MGEVAAGGMSGRAYLNSDRPYPHQDIRICVASLC